MAPTASKLRELARNADWRTFSAAAIAARLSPEEAETLYADPEAEIVTDAPAVHCHQERHDRVALCEDPRHADTTPGGFIEADQSDLIEVRR